MDETKSILTNIFQFTKPLAEKQTQPNTQKETALKTTQNPIKKDTAPAPVNYTLAQEAVDLLTGDTKTDEEKQGGILKFGKSLFGGIKIAPKDTRDGKIEETRQGRIGDCWLLSGINALSYTQEGANIIKDSLKYNEDGSTDVFLRGTGDTITITQEELNQAKLSGKYSSGDDDMIIIELAMERELDRIANGEIAVDPDAPGFMERSDDIQATSDNTTSVEGGFPSWSMYLLTGKKAKNTSDENAMERALLDFEANGNQDIAMGASISLGKTTMTDINGQEIHVATRHAYAIKEVKDGVVVFVNPWDSSIEYKVTMDEFLDNFSSVSVINLAKDEKHQYISKNNYIDPKTGNKVFIFEGTSLDDYSKKEVSYDNEGNPVDIKYYDEKGNIIAQRQYSTSGNCALEEREDSYAISRIDSQGWSGRAEKELTQTQFDRINRYSLLEYDQFDYFDIYEISNLNNLQWDYAMQYLAQNPSADYDDIMDAVEAMDFFDYTGTFLGEAADLFVNTWNTIFA